MKELNFRDNNHPPRFNAKQNYPSRIKWNKETGKQSKAELVINRPSMGKLLISDMQERMKQARLLTSK